MDPKRPEMPEDRAFEAPANEHPAEPSVDEETPVSPTGAKTGPVDVENAATDKQNANVHATTGGVEPANLFSSLDADVQAMFDDVPGARVERPVIETAADNVSTGTEPIVQDAFAPPAIEEVVASLSATPIADVPAATLARDMVAGWQDVPAELGPDHDKATADHGATTHDRFPESISQSVTTERVESPSETKEDFDTFDRTPRVDPANYIAIDDLLGRHDDPIAVQRGPVRTDDESWRPSITLLSRTSGDPSLPERPADAVVPERSADTDLSPRAKSLQSPTSDGGPPLARPIFLVAVPDEQTRLVLDEALAEAGRRDAKTAAEIAQQQVEDAFWLRACEERALYGGR